MQQPKAMHSQPPFGGAHAAYNRSKTNTYHSNKQGGTIAEGSLGIDGQTKQVHGAIELSDKDKALIAKFEAMKGSLTY
jgi:hypothetical protein